MEEEIENQIEDLPNYAHELNHDYRPSDPSDLIFTGAGDSLAGSLFAHYLSDGEAGAYDPFELQLYPSLTRDKLLFLTSVSGMTQANVLLARKAKRLAKRRIAVTADQQSPLAKECDDTIQLSYRSSGVLTAGTVSFTTSLLALASTVTRLPELRSLEELNVRARNWAEHLRSLPHAGFMFVGSGIGYALSAYGAFKIHEVLGQPADHQQTEQLGHSKLFSLRRTDNIVCVGTHNDQKTRQLSSRLSADGFRSHLLNLNAENRIIAALQAAFTLQHLAVSLARRRGLRECHFLSDENRLRLSSRLIY
jgi:fructoselysine-6-P-deglycase FrlB-like protein